MTSRSLRHALAASAAAVLALTLAGCGGGNDEQQPQTGGNVVAAAAPVVTITDDVAGESRYNAALPAVVAELERLGLAQPSEGAICVFLPGFTGRDELRALFDEG